jgi:Rho-binding antiterminator
MMTDYIPVDCRLHSEYELAVMHKQKYRLTWCDTDGIVYLESVTPTDLLARNNEEYLKVVNNEGVEQEIRLDRIKRLLREYT